MDAAIPVPLMTEPPLGKVLMDWAVPPAAWNERKVVIVRRPVAPPENVFWLVKVAPLTFDTNELESVTNDVLYAETTVPAGKTAVPPVTVMVWPVPMVVAARVPARLTATVLGALNVPVRVVSVR